MVATHVRWSHFLLLMFRSTESRVVHNDGHRQEGSPVCRIRHTLQNKSKALGKVVTYEHTGNVLHTLN
jgi:hypothetical protein